MASAGRTQKPFLFRPPKHNPFLISIAKHLLLPPFLRLKLKIGRVEVSDDDLRKLKMLEGQRIILAPNHSEEFEPCILFTVSKLLKQEFNYLTARELFQGYPLASWFLQGIGAYSINRGTPDRASFRMTRQLLVEGKRWLVVFPEGVAVGLGDMVMPFQEGTVQLAFWAFEDLLKLGTPSPVIFVPIAIKYLYLGDVRPEMDTSLRRLEERLMLPAEVGVSLVGRLRRVGEAVLGANEKANNVRPRKGTDLDERMRFMKDLLVARISGALGMALRADESLIERIRTLQNAIDQILYAEPEGSAYERDLQARRQQEVSELSEYLQQVKNFVALDTAYVEERLTAERFLDVLALLEREVFGKRQFWGPRKAVLRVGEPVDISDYAAAYRDDRQATVSRIARQLESSVRQMLEELSARSTMLSSDE